MGAALYAEADFNGPTDRLGIFNAAPLAPTFAPNPSPRAWPLGPATLRKLVPGRVKGAGDNVGFHGVAAAR